jgi:hypothetical protein
MGAGASTGASDPGGNDRERETEFSVKTACNIDSIQALTDVRLRISHEALVIVSKDGLVRVIAIHSNLRSLIMLRFLIFFADAAFAFPVPHYFVLGPLFEDISISNISEKPSAEYPEIFDRAGEAVGRYDITHREKSDDRHGEAHGE